MRRLRGMLIGDPVVILSVLFFGILSYFVAFFDKSGRKQAQLAGVWARTLLAGCGIQVAAEGMDNIDPNGSYIFAANHLSYIDTPTIMASIRVQFRFLAKSGLFEIPLMGGHLTRGGHISVPRDDPRGSIKTMQVAAEVIQKQRISLLIFPEGGRAHDGVLKEFKEGGAYIAIRAGVPIVPTVLVGTQLILPFGGGVVVPGTVKLKVLKPIETTGMTLKDRGKLTAQVRASIAAELEAEGFQVERLEPAQTKS